MDPVDIGIGIAIASGAIGGVVMAVLIVRAALRRWIERAPAKPAHDIGELAAQLQRVAEEVAELQERVDFTERVLAQERDSARLREPS